MLGEKLKELRMAKHVSQQEVALQLHINRGTYAHYEINKRQPDYDTLKILADYFDVSVDFLLENTIKPKYNPDDEFVMKIKSLSPESKEKALEYLEMLKTLEKVKSDENRADSHKTS
jgi:transcriptional regulator with XRE-family HTH domain